MSCNNQQYYLFQNKGKSKHAAHQLQVRFYTGKSLMENRKLIPTDSSDKTAHGLVVFDGFCVLCSASVKFLLKIDKNELLKFTTIQSAPSSEGRKETGITSSQPASIVYIENEQLFTESEAIVRILSRIGGVWKPLAAMLSFIPRKWRDYLYRLIAKHRYRIFGKKKQCYITPIKYADRFVPEIDMEKIKAIKSKG